MILVSGCLLGINCKYDGGNNHQSGLEKLLKEGKAIPICPEQLGGGSTPRVPCEIVGGSGIDVLNGKAKVIGKDGKDYTALFIKGAEETLKIAQAANVKEVILKESSPSCGVNKIYNGSFTGTKKPGMGVTAALLTKNGIKVRQFPE